jgi:hypothetical protein
MHETARMAASCMAPLLRLRFSHTFVGSTSHCSSMGIWMPNRKLIRKVKRRRRNKHHIRTDVSEADLLLAERKQKRRADRPRALSVHDVHVADQVFQWRNRDENIADGIRHLRPP